MFRTNPWVVAVAAALLFPTATASALAARNNNSTSSAAAQRTPVPGISGTDNKARNEIVVSLELNDLSDMSADPGRSALDDAVQAERDRLTNVAKGHLGTRYVWGGTTPRGFDCSGFTRYVYKQIGVQLPRTARQQYKAGKPVKAGTWETGDLVFFDIMKGYVSHVGMYLGTYSFIHASNPRSGVKISTLKERYYKKTYVGARRFV